MAIALFGLTHTSVRDHFFPARAAFSASTKPTSSAVGEMIDGAAAELAGLLAAQNITASDLDSTNEPNAYAWCQDFVRLRAAIRVQESIAGAGSVPQFWRDEITNKTTMLEKYGSTLLIDVAQPTAPTRGPRSHVTNHDLDTGDEDLISDAVPRFRRDDVL